MHDVFFFTDIHGSRKLFDAIMNYCKEQDPEAHIIFGGDAIDRGPDGYQIMKELLDNPYITYLKGNHEDMFVSAALEIKDELMFPEYFTRKEVRDRIYWCRGYDYRYSHIHTSLGNGGLETLTDWVMDGMPMDLIERINHLPLTFSYENCDFCHAAGVYRTFKEAVDAEYEGKQVDEHAAESLLWSRTGLDIGWEPGRLAIFGHTPTPFLSEYTNIESPEEKEAVPIKYMSNTYPSMTGAKLDMDTGAVFTNRAFVLNILTMKAQGFEIENEIVKEIKMIQL